jgi:hypothetical protein
MRSVSPTLLTGAGLDRDFIVGSENLSHLQLVTAPAPRLRNSSARLPSIVIDPTAFAIADMLRRVFTSATIT